MRSPVGFEHTRSASYYDAPDAPSFDLFPKGSDDCLKYDKPLDSPSHISSTSSLPTANISGVDKPDATGSCLFYLFSMLHTCVVFILRHTCIYYFLFLVSDDAPPATDPINDVTMVELGDPITPVDPNTTGLTQHFL
jgi:hypothetical protein